MSVEPDVEPFSLSGYTYRERHARQTRLAMEEKVGIGSACRMSERLFRCSQRLMISPPAPDGRDWGIPDWRNQDAYPHHDQLSQEEWRWEFLRRRPGYRRDYLWPDSKFRSFSKGLYFELAYGLPDPADPRISAVDADRYNTLWNDDLLTIVPQDSTTSAFFRFLDDDDRYVTALCHETSRLVRPDSASSSLFLRVDLRRSVPTQLARLKEIASVYQESSSVKQVRRRPLLWPVYLRVLDAREAGASYNEIAGSFLRNDSDQRARDTIDAAIKLRQEWPY